MDRSYLDFERRHVLHQAGRFFVIHAKFNLNARRLSSAVAKRGDRVTCDQPHA